MNLRLESRETIVWFFMRVSNKGFTLVAFFSHHIASWRMFCNISSFIDWIAFTSDLFMKAEIVMMFSFFICKNILTSYISTRKRKLVQNLVSKSVNICKSHIFTSQRAWKSLGIVPISTSLIWILNPFFNAQTTKCGLTLTAFLWILNDFKTNFANEKII